MESLALHTGAPPVHWEYNTSCISVVEGKIFTPTVKHVDIPVYFLQKISYKVLFIPKYEKSSVMPANIYTKPCPFPIISRGTKWMAGFIFYPTSDT